MCYNYYFILNKKAEEPGVSTAQMRGNLITVEKRKSFDTAIDWEKRWNVTVVCAALSHKDWHNEKTWISRIFQPMLKTYWIKEYFYLLWQADF
jgi:hypothetical protein